MEVVVNSAWFLTCWGSSTNKQRPFLDRRTDGWTTPKIGSGFFSTYHPPPTGSFSFRLLRRWRLSHITSYNTNIFYSLRPNSRKSLAVGRDDEGLLSISRDVLGLFVAWSGRYFPFCFCLLLMRCFYWFCLLVLHISSWGLAWGVRSMGAGKGDLNVVDEEIGLVWWVAGYVGEGELEVG